VKSKKARKRAADFLSDNEEDVEPSEKPKEMAVKPKKKAKKTKLDKTEIPIVPAEVVVPQVSANANVKSQKKENASKAAGPDPSAKSTNSTQSLKAVASDVSSKGAKKAKKTEWPTKQMTKLVNKVLSNGDALTADGVNGVLEHASEQEVDITTANADPSASMQAEAQRTVDKEMADEVATEDESDDQGAALLAGFDSDGEDLAEDEGLDPANMGDLNLTKAQRKKLRQASRKESKEGTGVVYVGRIPKGFVERGMRQYFSQFGNITNLRLSRNKKTGASKHFAFIEFESNEVAKIVSQTMDNYLMFGHILKCKYAPSESLHPDTWKGANKRFKKVPYNKIEKRALEEPKTKDQWEGKIAREQSKREKRLSKAQSMGYDYDLPQIKSVDTALQQEKMSQQEEVKAIKPAAEAEEPTGAVDSPNETPKDAVALKRQRKRNKSQTGLVAETAEAKTAPVKDLIVETAPAPKAGKAKRAKKGGAASEGIPPIRLTEAPIETATNVDKPTGKKPKKAKKTAATSLATSVEAATVAPVSASKSDALDLSALQREASQESERLSVDFPVTTFVFPEGKDEELPVPADMTPKSEKKSKSKKAKKSKATDAVAAQMQLNAELNDTVELVKGDVESDVDIAATAAVLPTPGGGEKKVKAGKKAKVAVKVEKVEMPKDGEAQAETQSWADSTKVKKAKKAKKEKVNAKA
jgi:nucleolar protein 15